MSYERYLEGHYDYWWMHEQAREDRLQAERISNKAEKLKDKTRTQLLDDTLGEENVADADEDAIQKIYDDYASNKDEYLVDGAYLTCNMAIDEEREILGVRCGIQLNKRTENRRVTKLHVYGQTQKINGGLAATVKDHTLNRNIAPFKCNCRNIPDRDFEIQEFHEKINLCKEYGTCQVLMRLEDDWENIIKSDDYARFDYIDNGKEIKDAMAITLKSMLFCRHGGIITPVTSGQKVRTSYTIEDIELDVANGLYTWEDFKYLAATLAGEANTYEGYVALVYEILNRCKSRGKSVKEVVTQHGQYTGFRESKVEVMPDDLTGGAIIAVLRGEVDNPIGDCEYHFGRINGYDLWYEEKKCKIVIVIGNDKDKNVFFNPYGSVHNQKESKTDDAVVIYNHITGVWELDGVIKYEK